MYSHVMLGANDIEQSKKFYDAIMDALGYPAGSFDERGRILYINEKGILGVAKPLNGEEATIGNGMTIGFKVDTQAKVDAWHAAGIANGGTTCEEPPGVRDGGGHKLYLAYMRDPTGNKLCATHFIE